MMHLVRANSPEFGRLWNDLVADGEHLDALYGNANLAYYREYCGGQDAEDVSLLVINKTVPLCGVKAFRRKLESGISEISCFGLPLLHAECPVAGAAERIRAQRLLRNEIENLLKMQSAGTIIRYKDTLRGGILSPLGRLLLDMGGEATPSFTQIIDLTQPEERLHQGLTKAYKWAVNWGSKHFVTSVLDRASITAAHIEQFHLLHAKAAGRETRTAKSWSLQHDMVCAGEAFCIFAWMDNALVSAALFPHSRSHCFYGVSASRRDLFDKPLSHGVIWSAMLHAKALGLRHFEMGEQSFPMAPRHNPPNKELGISFFKRAFGGEPNVFLDVCLKLNKGHESHLSV